MDSEIVTALLNKEQVEEWKTLFSKISRNFLEAEKDTFRDFPEVFKKMRDSPEVFEKMRNLVIEFKTVLEFKAERKINKQK